MKTIEETTEQTEPTGFHIDSDSAANWLLRKLANIEGEKARIKAQAEEMIRQLDTDAVSLRFLYLSELEAYTRRKLAENGNRRRTLAFLQGTCRLRSVPASLKVSDPAAALNHAKANALPCIVTTERLDAQRYRELAEATGEALPGLEIVPDHESFTISFGSSE